MKTQNAQSNATHTPGPCEQIRGHAFALEAMAANLTQFGGLDADTQRELSEYRTMVERFSRAIVNESHKAESNSFRAECLRVAVANSLPLIQRVASNRQFMALAGPCREALNKLNAAFYGQPARAKGQP